MPKHNHEYLNYALVVMTGYGRGNWHWTIYIYDTYCTFSMKTYSKNVGNEHSADGYDYEEYECCVCYVY